MFAGNASKAGLVTVLAFAACAAAHGATFATFDVPQFQANGFRYGDFDDDFFGNFDVSNGYFSLDLTEDIDLANGFFGGVGSDVLADFDSATTNLEVTFAVGPDNVAGSFNVVLADNDGEGIGEEYQYAIDLTTVTPADGFVTRVLPLDSFVFRQAGFELIDGDMELNYGLTQIQIQSIFGGTDRLQVDVQSVTLVDPDAPDNPLLIELTPATYASQPQSFDFGQFQTAGVVDQTSGNFVIDTTSVAAPDLNGGLGFNGLNIDFDANLYAIEVEAKLLTGNTAEGFNVVLGDNDGDDSGPMLGSEDFNFNIPTENFNTDDFSTFRLPLGSGSESDIVTAFESTNGGDGLQNFDLTQMQIQMNGDTSLPLVIDIARVSLVRLTVLDGDYNADGVVDAADYTVYRDNLGADEAVLKGVGDGSGTVDEGDYFVWRDNYGATAVGVVATAVPEATTASLLVFGLLAGWGRTRAS